jgi:hypothetical protein
MVADAERPVTERDKVARRLQVIYALTEAIRIPLPEPAITYLISDSSVASVIPGPRIVNELLQTSRHAAKDPYHRSSFSRSKEYAVSLNHSQTQATSNTVGVARPGSAYRMSTLA